MKNIIVLTYCFLFLGLSELFSQKDIFQKLVGSYLGQKTPGTTAEIFAQNITSNEYSNGGFVFSQKGNEVFFFSITKTGKQVLQYSKIENNYWTKPQKIFLFNSTNAIHPFFSVDSGKIYFGSNRQIGPKEEVQYYNIWVSEKVNNRWNDPVPLSSVINTGFENCGSFSNNILYFRRVSPKTKGDIFQSLHVEEEFVEPVKLPAEINTVYDESHPAISPDNNYLIFSSKRPGGFNNGKDELWISFREKDGDWSEAKNMGNEINNGNNTSCTTISPDGKFIFFLRIENGLGVSYWVSSEIIEKLRVK